MRHPSRDPLINWGVYPVGAACFSLGLQPQKCIATGTSIIQSERTHHDICAFWGGNLADDLLVGDNAKWVWLKIKELGLRGF